MQEEIFFPLGGGIAGASIYSNLGGIGVIGGFGAFGVGLTGMTAAGAVMGSAFYGAVKGIEDGDAGVFVASGLGAVGGIGTSTIFGGMGASFAGGAFGIGMFSMAAMGGIFGLGIYGLGKMFGSSQSTEYFAETFNRMEEKIFYEEAYFQAMLELSSAQADSILAELAWKQKLNELDVEEELETLKSQNNTKKKLKLSWNPFNNSYEFIDNGIEEEFINTEPESFEIELEENFVWKSVKTLKGHTGTINSLAIHGNTIASSSKDCTVCLWDMEAEKHLFSFFEPSEVNDIAINDQIIVAVNQSRNITSWKLQNKTLHQKFFRSPYDSMYRYLQDDDCHDGLIYSLVLSHDGKTLFSSGGDKTIRAWSTSTGKLRFTLTGQTDSAISLAISSSDRYLISGSADKTIRIWDLNNLSLGAQVIVAHEDWVTSLAISSDEKYLVSGSKDKTIKLWDFQSLEQVYSLRHESAVWSVAIDFDSSTIASGCSDQTVTIWDIRTGNMSQTLQASSPVIYSDDGKYLITGNSKNQIVIWQRISVNNRSRINFEIAKQWWIVLGLEQDASINELKTAYYDLARQYHPDLNFSTDAKQMMQVINQAYDEAIKTTILSL